MASDSINSTRILIMFVYTVFLIGLSPFLTEVNSAHKCGCSDVTNNCENDHPSTPIKQELPGYELVLVHALWRNGDRAPISIYPTDPNQEDKWRYGFNQLTPRGMAQMFKLGRILRKRYIVDRPLISQRYENKEVYIRSTQFFRTLASAESTMAGMFSVSEIPDKDIPRKSNSNDNTSSLLWPSHWVPVPVPSLPFSNDSLLPIDITRRHCPRGDQIIAELRNTSIYREIAEKNKEFLAYINEKAGVSTPYTLETVYQLYNAASKERANNLPQPSWFNDTVFEQVEYLSSQVFTFSMIFAPWAYSNEYFRLVGGPILKEILDRISLKVECLLSMKGKNNANSSACDFALSEMHTIRGLKYYAYSGYQTTTSAIAYITNVFKQLMGVPQQSPPLSSSLLLELWMPTADNTTNDPPMIRMLYRPSVNDDAGEYKSFTAFVRGCTGGDFCPLDAFKQGQKNFLPVDIDKECAAV